MRIREEILRIKGEIAFWACLILAFVVPYVFLKVIFGLFCAAAIVNDWRLFKQGDPFGYGKYQNKRWW